MGYVKERKTVFDALCRLTDSFHGENSNISSHCLLTRDTLSAAYLWFFIKGECGYALFEIHNGFSNINGFSFDNSSTSLPRTAV